MLDQKTVLSPIRVPIIQPTLLDSEKTPAINGNAQQPPNGTKKTKGSAVRQILAAFVAQLGTVNTGMVFGFSAIAIPQLLEADSSIPITISESSWIGKSSSYF